MASQNCIARARSVPIEEQIAARGHHLRRCGGELIGPCPVCGGHDRFAVNPKKAVWNCRGCCKGGDLIDLVRHLDGCGVTDAVELLTGEKSTDLDRAAVRPDRAKLAKARAEDAERDRAHKAERLHTARWLWSQRKPIVGSLAERYLREKRAISCPLPATLGFLPAHDEYPPAMIAAFGLTHEIEPGVIEIADDSLRGVHLTRLLPDGSDRECGDNAKIMIGLSTGSPIVLAPPDDLLGLAITEGIEDALTAYQVTGLGAWAAGSAGRMPALAETLPGYIECVTIFAHSDLAGQHSAFALAEALDRRFIALDPRGIEVFVEGVHS